tara:strand:- start:885 stop:1079 length:195 start_codon:yes stop_codon:yes gene_type:complete
VESQEDQVDPIQEVNQHPEEQVVVLGQEVEVEQVQEEHLHLEQHLKQVEVEQEDQGVNVIYELK